MKNFQRKNLGAFFAAVRAAKNRAFRDSAIAPAPAADDRGGFASLQSRLHGRAVILQSKIMTSQDAWASSDFAKAKS
ncbi:MAG: hypothetical protein LBP27_06315 [Treponema sp.]|jgi:hypothetical protein|nr:hypothetical protein [Treponema sp.]